MVCCVAATVEPGRYHRNDANEATVKTPGYILKKYRGQQPSLIIHLHPTNFRFDQQDGSFPYNSPMKVVLEHLKAQTVPHDMVDELTNAGVKFYESLWAVPVGPNVSC